MPDRPLVFVTRALPGDALGRLAQTAEVDIWPGDLPPSYDELRRRCAEACGIISLLTDRIDAELIDASPGLRVISNVAVGYDNIDLGAAFARGIPVGHTPGILTETTADLAFALLLAAARRITEAARFVREARWKTWDPQLMLGHDVHGATLGIVGFGQIGQALARRARGFDMRVLYAARREPPAAARGFGQRVALDDLLRASAFVSLHVPLTPETRRLIGERELRLMRPSAILVNTARGAIVDQPALVRALHEGWIAGAGLDVMEEEPLPPSDALLTAPNVVLLPHIGSASHATRAYMASLAVDNCIAGLRGEPLPHQVSGSAFAADAS